MELENQLFYEASIEDLKRGCIKEEEGYRCIICGKHFTKGEIYTVHGKLFDAHKAVLLHIKEEHDSVLAYLLKINPSAMGLSELQLELVNLFASGWSDKDIASYLGVAASTIRNHRYKLREKEKQAKIFIALMQLLEEKNLRQKDQDRVEVKLSSIPGIIYKRDYALPISKREEEKIIQQHITKEGKLRSYPSYEKGRQVILRKMIQSFDKGRRYTEGEVSEILSHIYRDGAFLKKELLEYDLLRRTDKGAIYWVSEK